MHQQRRVDLDTTIRGKECLMQFQVDERWSTSGVLFPVQTWSGSKNHFFPKKHNFRSKITIFYLLNQNKMINWN